jgi:hypothetical protein
MGQAPLNLQQVVEHFSNFRDGWSFHILASFIFAAFGFPHRARAAARA